jgi:hypothetical protein
VGDLFLPIADICSDAGLVVRVTEVNAGWETRARSSGGFDAMPLGVMMHHAASARGADSAGIVNYQVRGNPDNPVGNMTLDRDGSVWPVAAGASNCSGKGGPWPMSRGTVPLDKGNTTLVNVEACNDGVGETWPTAMIDGYFALILAVNAWCGNAPTDVVTHNVYAPTRKIDPATCDAVEGPWRPRASTTSGTWDLFDIADELAARSSSTPTPEVDMTDEQARQLADVHRWITQAIEPSMFSDPGGNPMSVPWGVGWTWSLLQTVSAQVAALDARIAALE